MLDVLLTLAATLQSFLSTVKEFFADQRFIGTACHDVFLFHPATVSTIAKHLAERAFRQRFAGAWADQTHCRDDLQHFHHVVTVSNQSERLAHQLSAFRVWHKVLHSVVRAVQISQRRKMQNVCQTEHRNASGT